MQLFNPGIVWQLLLLMVTAAVGAAAYDQPAAEQAVPTTLDLTLMKQVVDNLAENQAISPFVMSTLMTQVWLGAGGSTRDEMTPVLGLESDGAGAGQLGFLDGYSSAIDYLSSDNSKVTTAVFNRIYVRGSFPVKPSYSQSLRVGYGADVQKFSSPEDAATEINTAVSNVTHGRIKDLVSPGIMGDVSLALISALYFKAQWKDPFEPAVSANFLTAEGERRVDMMWTRESTDLPYVSMPTFEAVAVPYTDPDYILLLLRPPERSMASVQALRDALDTLNITDIVHRMHNLPIFLRMPKFKIETEYQLPDQLKALGIQEIFDARADLSGISDIRLYVSAVIHKVFMEVNEEGTEAAGAGAVLSVPFSMPPPPVHFDLDRPFFAVVYNRKHQISLFSAYVASPSSGNRTVAEQAVPTTLDLPLMKQVVDNLAENQAISPFVMSTLMTQVWLGTGGSTRDEMTPVLGLESDGAGAGQLGFLDGYSSAIDYLSSDNSNVTTAVFNRIYVRGGFPIKPSYSQTLRVGYGADVQRFSSPKEAATEINTAVSNVTHGRIKDLVTEDILQDAGVVLVSALYFKAQWKRPFQPARKANFLTAEGERRVDMMWTREPMDLMYARLPTFEAVAVPYTDPDYIMLLLRPPERSMASVQALRDVLDTLNITDIVHRMEEKTCLLRMPKFKIETEYMLPNQLKALGINEIFLTTGDFSGVAQYRRLYVSKVIHKVFMEVNEEGTEAAGAAAAAHVSFSSPPKFVLDRPFFAVVYNRRHQINLFSAYVASP